jgi:drug/metabolite transporter (DMT)-like permease
MSCSQLWPRAFFPLAETVFEPLHRPPMHQLCGLDRCACITNLFTWLVRDLQTAPLSATIAAGYLGIFPAALGYVTWAYTLARVPAARAASFLYLVPAVTLGIAWIWLGEWPTWLALLGGAIAILGVVIVNLFGKSATTEKSGRENTPRRTQPIMPGQRTAPPTR